MSLPLSHASTLKIAIVIFYIHLFQILMNACPVRVVLKLITTAQTSQDFTNAHVVRDISRATETRRAVLVCNTI
jgi:hypothetical protein